MDPVSTTHRASRRIVQPFAGCFDRIHLGSLRVARSVRGDGSRAGCVCASRHLPTLDPKDHKEPTMRDAPDLRHRTGSPPDPTSSHRRRPHRSARRRAVAVGAVAIGALLLAACGSSSSASSSTTAASPATSGSGSPSITAFFSCLKQHGVSIAGPSTSGGAPTGSFPAGGAPPAGTGGRSPGQFNSPKFKKASAACASLRPKQFAPAGGASSPKFAAYRNCLKIHGVTLPSATSRSGGSTPPTTLGTTDPKVKAALAACSSLQPKLTPPSGAGAPAGSG